MLKKMLFLSVICLLASENCNAMGKLSKIISGTKTSSFCMKLAISAKMSRAGQIACLERNKENAYDIFIDTFEAHPLSKGVDLKDTLLSRCDYSQKYFKIKDGVCEIARPFHKFENIS